MNKSMAILAILMAGQFSLAHATHEVKSVDGEVTDSPKTLEGSANQSSLSADHNVGLHPSLTTDPTEFQGSLSTRQTLTHVDFSSVAGQFAPLYVEGNNFAVAIYGTEKAVTSYQGLPATYWFGDQAESTFVLANGSVQIVFPQDVYAASLMIDTSAYNQKLQRELQTVTDVKAGTMLIDANGVIVGQSSITVKSDVAFLGILSDISFRSVIVSSTAEPWAFSDLNYEAEASVAK